MTNTEWMAIVRENRQELMSIILDFHPMYRSVTGRPYADDIVEGPEKACAEIRQQIRNKWDDGFPSIMFNEAIEKNDHNAIMALLMDVWFGIPESVSFIQNISGYREMIALMETPVDE